MDCGSTFVKYILFVFNLLCAICGILLIVFGSLVLSNMSEVKNLSEISYTSGVPIIIIVLGSIVFLISFLGCCGAIRESNCMTMTYSVLLLILFCCQLALVIYTWVNKDAYLKSMEATVDDIWNRHKENPKLMDTLQIAFKCCGKNSPLDWTANFESVPLSCCGQNASSCNVATAYVSGCSRAYKNFWESNINITRFAGIAVALIEFVGLIFGCCLSNSIRNQHRRSAY